MANRYANLVGSNKIKDEWQKINEGFDKVQQEMDEKPDASIAQVNDIQLGADDTLTLEGGTGITVTTVPGEKKVRFVATGESTPGPHAIEHITGGSDVIPNATTSASGLMSAADKLALDAHIAALVSDPGGVHGFRVESGIFTPFLAGLNNAGNHAYAFRNGMYVKQGRMVFCYISLALTEKDNTMSGPVIIGGLPFPANMIPNHSSGVAIGNYRNINKGNDNEITGRIDSSATYIRFFESGDNIGVVDLLPSKITDTTTFFLTAIYPTN